MGRHSSGTQEVVSVCEEEGLHGVHRRLRRDKHPKTKEGCKKFSGKTGCHPKEANPKKASVRGT
jgi:hypothetical protein